ncbi:hypothetical protein CVT26_009108 [Gymnopilus dilepis]|uniref:Uncharacterized protein n=1 Tax=Gymnopilus dilepis TaxID=231916 RepID=A0A409WUN1_9AGAR|nr:hypothetical protein CVT26_009108 [Gymnopilus dilepis]
MTKTAEEIPLIFFLLVADMLHDPQQSRIIGEAGCGRTRFIEEAIPTEEVKPSSQDCKEYAFREPDCYLVDTPGLHQGLAADVQSLKKIKKWVKGCGKGNEPLTVKNMPLSGEMGNREEHWTIEEKDSEKNYTAAQIIQGIFQHKRAEKQEKDSHSRKWSFANLGRDFKNVLPKRACTRP